jgi:phosphatidylcholine synthase
MDAEQDRPRRAGAAAAEAAPAWAVHALTATSALFALLALDAVLDESWRLALLWLFSALAVDGIDGTLARAVDVKRRTPGFDGAALDLIVDYLTYVFVPTLFIWRAGLVPDAWALPLAALIQYSALYHFARSDMKTEDNYFRGFPALWNLVAFYLWVIGTSETAGGIVVALLALSSFTSVAFVHPFRVRDYGAALPVLALVWALATVALLWPEWSESVRGAIFWTSVATGLVLIGLGLWRAVRGPRLSPKSS